MEKTKKLVRRGLVENELLERAAELMAERGFNGTTLQDVADTVGLTRAALYHYFDSKEALLTALVEGISTARAVELKKIRCDPGLTASEKLLGITRMMVVNVTSQTARFRLLLQSESELPAELSAKHARARREILKQLVELFEEGMRSGELRPVDPHIAAFSLLGMCNWTAWWYKPDQNGTPEAVADEIGAIALSSFCSAAPALPPPEDDLRATIARMRGDLARLERLIAPA